MVEKNRKQTVSEETSCAVLFIRAYVRLSIETGGAKRSEGYLFGFLHQFLCVLGYSVQSADVVFLYSAVAASVGGCRCNGIQTREGSLQALYERTTSARNSTGRYSRDIDPCGETTYVS